MRHAIAKAMLLTAIVGLMGSAQAQAEKSVWVSQRMPMESGALMWGTKRLLECEKKSVRADSEIQSDLSAWMSQAECLEEKVPAMKRFERWTDEDQKRAVELSKLMGDPEALRKIKEAFLSAEMDGSTMGQLTMMNAWEQAAMAAAQAGDQEAMKAIQQRAKAQMKRISQSRVERFKELIEWQKSGEARATVESFERQESAWGRHLALLGRLVESHGQDPQRAKRIKALEGQERAEARRALIKELEAPALADVEGWKRAAQEKEKAR